MRQTLSYNMLCMSPGLRHTVLADKTFNCIIKLHYSPHLALLSLGHSLGSLSACNNFVFVVVVLLLVGVLLAADNVNEWFPAGL